MKDFDANFGPSTRIAFGCIYMGLVLVSLPIYGTIVWIFNTRPTFRRNPCYRIMSAIGLCDFVYLIGQFGVGYAVAVGLQFSDAVERILFSIPNAGFNGSIILIMLLALNRFCVLTNYVRPRTWVYTIAIILCWLYALAVFLLFAIYGDGIQLNQQFMLTVFNKEHEYVRNFYLFSVIISPVAFGTSLVIYILITIYLICKRKQIRSRISNQEVNYRTEIKILLQGVLMFACGVFINVNAMYGQTIFPRSYLYTGSLNSFLIFHSGLFYPIVYLSLNSDLRKAIRQSFSTNLKESVVHVSTVPFSL